MELNEKSSLGFTVFVKTTVDFHPQLVYRVFCVWGMFCGVLFCLVFLIP